jgi:hypothetical protein
MKHLSGTKAGKGRKRFVTTLGDVISAAYEAAPGFGDKKLQRALTLLRDEVDRDLALLGIHSIGEITPDLVRKI